MKPKFRRRLKDNISNKEADNCKQKVLKLHPDTNAKAKVVKALRIIVKIKMYVAIQQSKLDFSIY